MWAEPSIPQPPARAHPATCPHHAALRGRSVSARWGLGGWGDWPRGTWSTCLRPGGPRYAERPAPTPRVPPEEQAAGSQRRWRGDARLSLRAGSGRPPGPLPGPTRSRSPAMRPHAPRKPWSGGVGGKAEATVRGRGTRIPCFKVTGPARLPGCRSPAQAPVPAARPQHLLGPPARPPWEGGEASGSPWPRGPAAVRPRGPTLATQDPPRRPPSQSAAAGHRLRSHHAPSVLTLTHACFRLNTCVRCVPAGNVHKVTGVTLLSASLVFHNARALAGDTRGPRQRGPCQRGPCARRTPRRRAGPPKRITDRAACHADPSAPRHRARRCPRKTPVFPLVPDEITLSTPQEWPDTRPATPAQGPQMPRHRMGPQLRKHVAFGAFFFFFFYEWPFKGETSTHLAFGQHTEPLRTCPVTRPEAPGCHFLVHGWPSTTGGFER